MIAIIASRFQDANQTISGWVSALMIAFTIPAVLFGSVAGVFVDRWSKKAVLVASNLLRGILVLAVPLLLWITQDWKPIYSLPVGFLRVAGDYFFGFHTDPVFCSGRAGGDSTDCEASKLALSELALHDNDDGIVDYRLCSG
jgi:MFS family permease